MPNGPQPNPGEPNTVCRLEPLQQPECDPQTDRKRCAEDYRRTEARRACNRDLEPVKNRNNGEEDFLMNEEEGHPSYAANFTKGMPLHPDDTKAAQLGEVDPNAYEQLITAATTQDPDDFDKIPQPPDVQRGVIRPFVDPQAGVAFSIEGSDPASVAKFDEQLNILRLELVPTFESPRLAAEMGEVYLRSLLRDIWVGEFVGETAQPGSDLERAIRILEEFSDPNWPTVNGQQVTPQLFGRSELEGDTIGPPISQFEWIGTAIGDPGTLANQFNAGLPSPRNGTRLMPPENVEGLELSRKDGYVLMGTFAIDQRQFEIQPGKDYVFDYGPWLKIQEGFEPDERNQFTGDRRFIRSSRDLAHLVHFDQVYQEFYKATLLILGMQGRAEELDIPLFGEGNPFAQVANQMGFINFGNAHVLTLLAEACQRALKAVWYEKWINQRRLRPEAMAARIHNLVLDPSLITRYPINDEIWQTQNAQELLQWISDENAAQGARPPSYLLKQVYPEGSPMHTSFPAGHAAIAGCCGTIKKGIFNELFPITGPGEPILIATPDGLNLVDYQGAEGSEFELTLRGEIHKLVSNITFGRDWAGVHYRSDGWEGLLAGEYIGITILQEQARSWNPDQYIELTTFLGTPIRIQAGGEIVIIS
jgi:hypothetical protein